MTRDDPAAAAAAAGYSLTYLSLLQPLLDGRFCLVPENLGARFAKKCSLNNSVLRLCLTHSRIRNSPAVTIGCSDVTLINGHDTISML